MTGGGKYGHSGSTTETLVRDGGTAWKYAARLPTEIYGIKGIGFNGHFIVAGNPQSGFFYVCLSHRLIGQLDMGRQTSYTRMPLGLKKGSLPGMLKKKK